MRTGVLALVALWAAAASPASAQPVVSEQQREAIRGIPDRWGVTLGSFWQTFDTRVRLDGRTVSGDEIDVEEEFDLAKDITSLQLNAFYRFSARHRIDLSYISWSRAHTTTIQREIHWGDAVYDAGASVNAKASAEMVNAVYKYSFINNGKVNFGLNGGVSSLWTATSLSGAGTVAGGGPVAGAVTRSEDVIFPIPVIGAHFEMTLAKRCFWRAEENFFQARVAGYDGNVSEFTTSVDYYFTRNVGVGGGYASTLYRVTRSGDNGGDLFVRYGFSGLFAYLACSF